MSCSPPKARVQEVRSQAEGLRASECRIPGGEPVRAHDPQQPPAMSACWKRSIGMAIPCFEAPTISQIRLAS